MDGLLATLEATGVAQALRFSRWGYAAVNTAHVLGIALLVGASVAMNLRLLGLWRSRLDAAAVVPMLSSVAAAGLALAVVAGALLFSVRATEYAGLTVFWIKLALIATGTVSALGAHLLYRRDLSRAGHAARIRIAVVSLACWVGALVAGRLIAFFGG